MKWFKITPVRLDGSHSAYRHVYASDQLQAVRSIEYFGLPGHVLNPLVVEVDSSEVNYKQRAFAEATSEELRNILRERGWKVVLS